MGGINADSITVHEIPGLSMQHNNFPLLSSIFIGFLATNIKCNNWSAKLTCVVSAQQLVFVGSVREQNCHGC